MNIDYESVKASVIELLINGHEAFKESITINSSGSSAGMRVKKYLRHLANVKTSILIKIIPGSTKFPKTEGTRGQGGQWHYIRSTLRLEVGEHWLFNHFKISPYKQYEDFDGWAARENDRYTCFTFTDPTKGGTTSKQWVQVKLVELSQ